MEKVMDYSSSNLTNSCVNNAFVQTIYNGNGFSTQLKLSETDLETFRTMIRMQWLYRLQLLAPKEINQFDKIGIERYHELSHLIDHAKAWPKTSRVLPKEAVAIVRKMDFFNQLEMEFGDILIADEERLGWENVYWRLVRPGNADFGSFHTENWFVQLGYYGTEINDLTREKVKIWISIHSTPGKNGLMIVPNSHHRTDWKWHVEERNGQKKNRLLTKM